MAKGLQARAFPVWGVGAVGGKRPGQALGRRSVFQHLPDKAWVRLIMIIKTISMTMSNIMLI